MADKVVQLEDKNSNNLYPVAGAVITDAVSTGAISNQAVTNPKIANGAINGVANDATAIGTAKLALDTVGTPNLRDQSVTSDKIDWATIKTDVPFIHKASAIGEEYNVTSDKGNVYTLTYVNGGTGVKVSGGGADIQRVIIDTCFVMKELPSPSPNTIGVHGVSGYSTYNKLRLFSGYNNNTALQAQIISSAPSTSGIYHTHFRLGSNDLQYNAGRIHTEWTRKPETNYWEGICSLSLDTDVYLFGLLEVEAFNNGTIPTAYKPDATNTNVELSTQQISIYE